MMSRTKMISNHVGIMNKMIPVIPRLIVSSYQRNDENDEFLEIEAAQKPEVNNDCEAAESTNGKPKNWKDFLEQLESKKESSFNEYQKDYESKIEFELKNRISIFKNEIEPALNVEVNKSRTAECIEKSRYLSPDVAYWNAKLNQVRLLSKSSRSLTMYFSMEINLIQKLHLSPSRRLPGWVILTL